MRDLSSSRRAIACSVLVMLLATPAAARPAAPSGAGKTFTSGGVTLWYEVRGHANGRPLIMVNGGPGFDHTYVLCSDAWDALARRGASCSTTSEATGGRARSRRIRPAPSAIRSPTSTRLRERLGAATIDLIGHSWGGYLVMAYAARHPDRIAHLVIADSAARQVVGHRVHLQVHLPRRHRSAEPARLRRCAGRHRGGKAEPGRSTSTGCSSRPRSATSSCRASAPTATTARSTRR